VGKYTKATRAFKSEKPLFFPPKREQHEFGLNE
jgi:hypothetical protein